MPLRLLLYFACFCCRHNGFTQYAPAAGQVGTTAIHKDSSAIVAWASGINVTRGLINISNPNQSHEGSNYASFGIPENALGPASGTSENVVSLGDGGVATLTFSKPIKNGDGPDFCVFENAFSDSFLELAFVEVSSDGERFVRFPSVCLTQTEIQISPFGALDPTKIHNLAGKYRQGFGTPFDLEDLADSSGIDLNHITHVRIIDVVGSINPEFGTVDSQGNLINDLFPTPFNSGGYDLDAVGVIHEGILHLSSFLESSIHLFPNPNNGTFYVSFSSNELVSFDLLDAFGRTCAYDYDTLNYCFQLNEALPTGVYFLQIKTDRSVLIKRIQVLRN